MRSSYATNLPRTDYRAMLVTQQRDLAALNVRSVRDFLKRSVSAADGLASGNTDDAPRHLDRSRSAVPTASVNNPTGVPDVSATPPPRAREGTMELKGQSATMLLAGARLESSVNTNSEANTPAATPATTQQDGEAESAFNDAKDATPLTRSRSPPDARSRSPQARQGNATPQMHESDNKSLQASAIGRPRRVSIIADEEPDMGGSSHAHMPHVQPLAQPVEVQFGDSVRAIKSPVLAENASFGRLEAEIPGTLDHVALGDLLEAVVSQLDKKGRSIGSHEIALMQRVADALPVRPGQGGSPASPKSGVQYANAVGSIRNFRNIMGSFSNSVVSPRTANHTASPSEDTDADRRWLEVVLQFTTRLTASAISDRLVIARTIQREVANATGASKTHVWLADHSTGTLVQHDVGQVAFMTDNQSLVGSAFNQGTTQRDEEHVALPLVCMGTVVGVLEATLPVQTPRTDEDEHTETVLETTVAISASFLHNATMFDDLLTHKRQGDAMLRMARLLSHDALEELTLVNTIMRTARELTHADRCSVFVVSSDRKTLRAYFENDDTFVEMPADVGLAGHVVRSGEVVNIPDAYDDPRFNRDVDRSTGYRTRSMLCLPVSYEGQIVAVAQLVNKLPVELFGHTHECVFSQQDEALFSTLSVFIGVCLRNCRANADLVAHKRRNEATLAVASKLSRTDIRQVNEVVKYVLKGAKELLCADRASLFLLDKERGTLYSTPDFNTDKVDIRVGKGTGFVGQVAATGKAIVVADAYADPRFNQQVDKQFGYRTQSLITVPIFGSTGEVIAVAQLINKKDVPFQFNESGGSFEPGESTRMERSGHSPAGSTLIADRTHRSQVRFVPFTDSDLQAFRQFALFAGMAISNANLLTFAVSAAEEAMKLNFHEQAADNPGAAKAGFTKRSSFRDAHMKAINTEMEAVMDMELDAETLALARTPKFDLFKVRRENPDRALDVTARMCADLIWGSGLPVRFSCDMPTLLRFIVACRGKYRAVPYHNFYHAVDVCQTVYHFLYEGGIASMLEPLECFVLLITALVHDMDHMGLNNSYHFKTESPLGILSAASGNTSVLEVHHCNLAIELLDEPATNIFKGLGDVVRAKAVRLLVDCVLATDMAKHGEYVKMISTLVRGDDGSGTFDVENDKHRRLAMVHVTKAADISNVTKPFEISRLWGMSVTEEFYRQGDAEKEKGVEVLPMNDRSLRTELAKGQLGFIDFLARPYYLAITSELFPELKYALDGIDANKRRWKEELDLSAIAAMAM